MERAHKNTVRRTRQYIRNKTKRVKRQGSGEEGTRHIDPISYPAILTPVQEERLKQILAKEAYQRSDEGQVEVRRRFMASFKFKGEGLKGL